MLPDRDVPVGLYRPIEGFPAGLTFLLTALGMENAPDHRTDKNPTPILAGGETLVRSEL
jgi:hypothetical protein